MAVEFGLLGDIEARVDGGVIDVGHARQRCVLAVLLVEANRTVSADQLLDRVWGDRPPSRARGTLRTYLSRLRQALAPAGPLITRRSGGYVLAVDEAAVDLHRFRRLVAQAGTADRDDRALALLDEALGLWRGDAFATLDTAWLNAVRSTLDRERFAAELDRADIGLRLGHHPRLVAELSTRVADHPLDERLAGQLMLTLYRCGRQADALEHYERLRRRLAEALGADPGPSLRKLHRQLLTSDPALTIPEPVEPALATGAFPVALAQLPPAVGGRRTRQLPMDIAEFTGRQAQLDRVRFVADETASTPAATKIIAIEGMAGVGKTRLAVHAAHHLVDEGRFGEVQLWVDLAGFTPGRSPVDPVRVLDDLLRSLGVPGDQIPSDLDARAALYRDRMARLRALVVLDNAAGEDQVRPLLPATSTCMVILTSRRSLSGMDGIFRLELDVFTPKESRTLLSRVLGDERTSAESDAAEDIGALCAYLPLAVSLAARRLQTRPAWKLRDLVDKLVGSRDRLSGLSRHGEIGPRAVFELSYRALPHARRRLFRLLGAHPGEDFTVASAAALGDLPLLQAETLLEELLDEHLLSQALPGRYGMHDLLRLFACELLDCEESRESRDAAAYRLVDHYLAAAEQATAVLLPTDHRHLVAAEQRSTRTEVRLEDRKQVLGWLEAEHTNVVAAAQFALTGDGEMARLGLRLVAALFHPFVYPGRSREHIRLNEIAACTAHRVGDRRALAQVLDDLGVNCAEVGRPDEAIEYSRQALELWREFGDRNGETSSLIGLGFAYRQLNRFEDAVTSLTRAWSVSTELGDPLSQVRALNQLCLCYQRLERFDKAISCGRECIEICRRTSNRRGEAIAIANLAWALQRHGAVTEAIERHRQSFALFHDLGDRYNEAEQLWGLGQAHHALGDAGQARAFWLESIDLLTEIDWLSPQDAAILRKQPVPDTPYIIRVNT